MGAVADPLQKEFDQPLEKVTRQKGEIPLGTERSRIVVTATPADDARDDQGEAR